MTGNVFVRGGVYENIGDEIPVLSQWFELKSPQKNMQHFTDNELLRPLIQANCDAHSKTSGGLEQLSEFSEPLSIQFFSYLYIAINQSVLEVHVCQLTVRKVLHVLLKSITARTTEVRQRKYIFPPFLS